MSTKVGFIGLGIMGGGMALNLLKAGFQVRAWNRTASRVDPIVEAGGEAGSSPADVAANSEIIVICVSDTPDVEAVVLGENGVLESVNEGSLVIDCSTISPQATKEIAAKLGEKGVHMLDAPISGGSEGAANGTLSIMVGGEAEQFERAMPVFEAMGKTITHVGATGAGQTVKLVIAGDDGDKLHGAPFQAFMADLNSRRPAPLHARVVQLPPVRTVLAQQHAHLVPRNPLAGEQQCPLPQLRSGAGSQPRFWPARYRRNRRLGRLRLVLPDDGRHHHGNGK